MFAERRPLSRFRDATDWNHSVCWNARIGAPDGGVHFALMSAIAPYAVLMHAENRSRWEPCPLGTSPIEGRIRGIRTSHGDVVLGREDLGYEVELEIEQIDDMAFEWYPPTPGRCSRFQALFIHIEDWRSAPPP